MTNEHQQEANEPLETLHVQRPFLFARNRPKFTVTDTKGYTAVIGHRPSGLQSDTIHDPQGKKICALDANAANVLIPRAMHAGEFSYDVEAPLGTIPNMCKKAGRAK